MGKITQNLNYLSGSPHIAPNAKYVKFDRDHIRRVVSLSDAVLASQNMIKQIDRDMHVVMANEAEKQPGQYSEMWPFLSSRVIAIENFVSEAVNVKDSGFEFILDEDGRIIELVENPIGRYYYDAEILNGKDLGNGLTTDAYRPRPLVQLYFEVYERHMLGKYGAQYFRPHPSEKTADGEKFFGEVFNELLDAIRSGAEAGNLARLDIQNESTAQQRFDKMMKYVRRCFKKRRRIFVIRMDLYYRSEFAEKVSIELAKQHHALFVNRLRALTDMKKELVGGFWKLEWTRRKGHHFHWVFMFDGSLVQDARKWSELIDEHWKKAVLEDAGYTHTGNYDDHKQVGTGMIHIDEDEEKFQIFVEKVIGYIAKKDQALCLKLTPGTRAWGTFTPGGRRTSRAGRPPKSRAVRPA
jgi:hypothetical protein